VRTSPRRTLVRSVRAALATVLVVALTTYLLLDRNHAEELGSGVRAAGDLLRTFSAPLLVAVLASGALALVAAQVARSGRARAAVRVDVRTRR
jgi:hypothetical protein